MPREAVHQGVLLEARPLAPIDISELPADGLVVVLDQITDPHNVGAILRTCGRLRRRRAGDDRAAYARIHRRARQVGFRRPRARADLLGRPTSPARWANSAISAIWRVGLDSEAPATLQATRLERPLALVLGAEDRGLRRLTREHCDALARLDLPGAIKSLNVSNACAIALSIAAAATKLTDGRQRRASRQLASSVGTAWAKLRS